MTGKEWRDFVEKANKHGINSQSYYADAASKITPEKREKRKKTKPKCPARNLTALTADDFFKEEKRMQIDCFKKALDNSTKKPKTYLPEKFDAYKCIEYMLENGVEIAKHNDENIIYYNVDGTWHYLRTKEGIDVLNASIPLEIKKKYDLDKSEKICERIGLFPDLQRRNIKSDPNRKYLLNFLDGVYDCRTGKIYPHNPDYMFFYCIQANASEIMNDYHDAPLLNAYLTNSLQGNEAKIITLQEMLGVTLSTIRDQKIAFFLLGKSNSGKSVILNVLKKLLNGFVSNVSFAQLNEKFAPAMLLGKWINISGEMSDLSENRIQTFKNVVGNDSIMAEFKHKDGFTLDNQALFIFGANEMPSITKPDQAYFNRLRILSYDVSVPKDKWVNNLAERMFFEEKGYLLKFAIDGLLRFIENGMELTYINMSDDLVESYKNSSNSFIEFVNASIRYCPGQKLKSSDIRSAYERFCKRNDMKALATNTCSSILKELFDTERTTVGHSGDKGFTNLTLINNYQNNEDD